jgi:hypothetical protein
VIFDVEAIGQTSTNQVLVYERLWVSALRRKDVSELCRLRAARAWLLPALRARLRSIEYGIAAT